MRRSRFLRLFSLSLLSFPLVACQGSPSGSATPQAPVVQLDPSPAAGATPTVVLATTTPTSLPATTTPSPGGLTYLDNATLLAIYGRAWGSAPVLGRLALYDNIDDMSREVAEFSVNLSKVNGGKKIIPVIHLIYGMAIPCDDAKSNCLYYLDSNKSDDVVKDYIEPAAKKGYLVILDTQFGRADSLTQVKRMVDKGYLKYDHVHVALDPEFHIVKQDQTTPGHPIGTIDVDEVNSVQALLDDYVQQNSLPHKKILMVHQFGDPNVNDGVPFMIQNKKSMKTYPNVDLVISADGFGAPDSKLSKYNKMTDPTVYPFIKYRAIKLFLDNPKADQRRIDKPITTFKMCFGVDPAPKGAKSKYMPDCVIIA